MLYFEDLQPGQRFSSRTHTVDEEQIIAFARQFDPQPFHTDPEAAKGTLFKGLVASGWLTAALSARLVVESLPIAGGLIGAGCETNWPRPVRPGDTLHVEGAILDIRPSRSHPDRGIATINADTVNQKGEVVQNNNVKLVVFRRG